MQIPNHDVIVLGAGAAGLMCAAQAGQRGKRVLVLDKAEKVGKKILISGGGRCNFTNLHVHPHAYLSQNPHFCKSALARYTSDDFMALMKRHGLTWTEKTLGQLFCDQKAPAVVTLLETECRQAGVRMRLNIQIDRIEQTDSGFCVCVGAETFQTTQLVIATGGASIPRMGSTDVALQLAKQFGIKNIPFTPALVPFTFPQLVLDKEFAGLAGLSTDVVARCGEGVFREKLLFTHRGLSGPAMLQISSYWRKGMAIEIDLLPSVNDASAWLLATQKQRSKAELKTVLSEHLPSRLAQRLCETVFPNRPLGQYAEKQLYAYGQTLKAWQLFPSGTEGMRTAEVCLGGVDTNELSSKTFEAKKVKGLYFIGEAVDVTGWLGGYNFQWAWSSGWCAGQSV